MDSHMFTQACKYLTKPVTLLLQSIHAPPHTPSPTAHTVMAVTTLPLTHTYAHLVKKLCPEEE